MPKLAYILLFVFSANSYSGTPLQQISRSITYTEQCPSGWQQKASTPDEYPVKKPLDRGFNLKLTRRSGHALSPSLISIRPTLSPDVSIVDEVNKYTLNTNFKSNNNLAASSELHFTVGHSTTFGLLTIKENTYHFCLGIYISSPPEFSTPQFFAFPNIMESTQQIYSFLGEVAVTNKRATNISIGDLIVTITGEH